MGDCIVSKSFVVQSAWDSIGSESFVEDLSLEIQDKASSIGLDEYFRYGGAIDEVLVDGLKLTGISQNGIIKGTFGIEFRESYHGGCRDIEWSDTYAGTMSFDLDPNSRELTVTGESIRLVAVSDEEEAPE